MDQGSLVDSQIDEGRALIERLIQNHFDVTAALWIKDFDDGRWRLHIASSAVDDRGLQEAYTEVFTTIRSMPNLRRIGVWELRLIGANSPIAKAIADLRNRFPARIPTWYRDAHLGDTDIEQAYIYEPAPQLDSASRTQPSGAACSSRIPEDDSSNAGDDAVKTVT